VSLWAVVDEDGSNERSSAGVTTSYLGTGIYAVDFNADVSQCAYVAQIGGVATSAPNEGIVHSYLRSGFTDQVRVETFEGQHPSTGDPRDRSFHIAVHC
jgi:hypothetical protein